MNADHAAADREPTRAQIKRWRKHLAEERMEARTYRDLSERRTGEERAVLLQLEEAERRHEEYWLARPGERGPPAPQAPAPPPPLATMPARKSARRLDGPGQHWTRAGAIPSGSVRTTCCPTPFSRTGGSGCAASPGRFDCRP